MKLIPLLGMANPRTTCPYSAPDRQGLPTSQAHIDSSPPLLLSLPLCPSYWSFGHLRSTSRGRDRHGPSIPQSRLEFSLHPNN